MARGKKREGKKGSFVRSVDLFTAELFPERHWRGPGSRGGEGDYTQRIAVTTRMTLALRWAVVRAILNNVSLTVRGKVTKTVSINHTF